eukprot:m.16390 g.16390  ORF g.16390 m.16390 type:complete len:895 (-) comp5685_c0_seq1:159-2843(-)
MTALKGYIVNILLVLHTSVCSSEVWLVASTDNDLFTTLSGINNLKINRVDTVSEALAGCNLSTDALLLLADNYPSQPVLVPVELLTAADKGLRVFVEFPSGLPLDNYTVPEIPCLNISKDTKPSIIVQSGLRSVCAPLSGQPVNLLYNGSWCGPNNNSIQWQQIKTLNPDKTLPPSVECQWTASKEPSSWAPLYVGACGVEPTLISGVPIHRCNTTSPSFPLPVPSIVQPPWYVRTVIVTDDVATAGLQKWRILQPQSPSTIQWCPACSDMNTPACRLICNNTILAAAQVAGYDNAAYKASMAEQMPVLFETLTQASQGNKMLVSGMGLSNFIKGRYAPADAWKVLWEYILKWVAPESDITLPQWKPTVHPAYNMNNDLPTNATIAAITKSAAWLTNNSKLLVEAKNSLNTSDFICCVQERGEVCKPQACSVHDACPSPQAPSSVTNITCIQEGWSSIISWNGSQAMMPLFIRTDGNAEAAMGLAAASVVGQSQHGEQWANTSKQLLDYMFRWSLSQSYVNSSAKDPTFGIVWWNQMDAGEKGFAKWSPEDYGDNAGNVLIGATISASLLKTCSWCQRMTYALFAEIRTTGRQGYRPQAVSFNSLQQSGWETFFNNPAVPSGSGPSAYTPHYGAYPTAYFVWAGHATGMRTLFSTPAKGYIEGLMASFSLGEWDWNESITNEIARMLLPLSWLVRDEPTPQNIDQLRNLSEVLLKGMVPCGTIRQSFGTGAEAGRCSPCVPRSNSEHGSGEGPILFNGTEPVSDALYTINFAIIGLWEAAFALNSASLFSSTFHLAEFLVRSQVSSERHSELSGAWFRAFDFSRWDYWASDTDWGYGPWVTETGWSNGWITTTLALMELNVSLWDTMDPSVLADADAICAEMLLEQASKYCVKG